jgi:MoxR-like ATPase
MDDTFPDTSPGLIKQDISASVSAIQTSIMKVFKGKKEAVDLLLTAFLAGGHVLLEDIPGVGKTTLGRTLAESFKGTFRRLQCTPDLMPADITGVSIYQQHEHEFVFHPGPVFCDVLLADELNRTSPRTQSALLEAMSEGQVTVDGVTRKLRSTFCCVATQNPYDHVGTYPLPESQRDRFLLCFGLGYPHIEQEYQLLCSDGAEGDLATLQHVWDLETAVSIRQQVRRVRVDESVRRYLLELVVQSRRTRGLLQGASPRAAIGWQRAAQAFALLNGRDFVAPEDVQALAVPALCHRITCKAGQNPAVVIEGIIEAVGVPR